MIELGNVHTESVVESTIHLFINGIVLTRYVDLFEKINNTYIINLPSVDHYTVRIQLADFIENLTTTLNSVPLQFLLCTCNAINPATTCRLASVITSIKFDLALPGDTITVCLNTLYTAMIVARTKCLTNVDISITQFIISSPSEMLKTNVLFILASPLFAINLTWTPTFDQFNKTLKFCAVAVDNNNYSSNQYYFNLFVDPTKISSTTSSTTSIISTNTTSITTTNESTTTITTIVTKCNYISLITEQSWSWITAVTFAQSSLIILIICVDDILTFYDS
ncbi:unnamed protein product [Rotaria sordida]|uniref:Uncharacterized protein n=1 Tax=Rotaria sordida TaxID=392033 RepID=A0A818QFM8_9BILA|nr:unnamed protein product [Rotaria sordida]CAF0854413.1 unnamed protein product [Rotaria sordida]CAF3635821.1 unnamed protein product [Rotaria sordida]CAF3714703.1 unnamed protein product [Rotaria sordida]